jgi:hypothetical protein
VLPGRAGFSGTAALSNTRTWGRVGPVSSQSWRSRPNSRSDTACRSPTGMPKASKAGHSQPCGAVTTPAGRTTGAL